MTLKNGRNQLKVERVKGGFVVPNAYQKPLGPFEPSKLFPKGEIQVPKERPTRAATSK